MTTVITITTTKRAIFKVIGMYCTSCKPIVENQLKDEKSVKKIDIDYMTDSIVVDFDPSQYNKRRNKR